MKATTRSGLDRDTLLRQIPPQYQSRIPHAQLTGSTYTLLQLALDRNDVATSRAVAKALGRSPASEPQNQIVALAANFTQEALDLLKEHGALVISLGEFGWTDASYARIRQH